MVVEARSVANRQRHQRNAAIAHANGDSLERDVLRTEASRAQRRGDAERRKKAIAVPHERRHPPRRTVVVERQEVVAERRGRVRERLQRRQDDRTVFYGGTKSIPGIAPGRLRGDVVPAHEPLVDGVCEQHDVATRLHRVSQREIALGARHLLAAQVVLRDGIGLCKDQVDGDDFGGRATEIVERARECHARPGPVAEDLREVADACVGDLDEDDVLRSGAGVGRMAHPPVVRLHLGRFQRPDAVKDQDDQRGERAKRQCRDQLAKGFRQTSSDNDGICTGFRDRPTA